ncbi:hypothetical protein GCM10009737_21730 [Nocardioides lentus]|uniref:Uncharacterized protein n=1 Tax=Nocardioides lentus TaxID=338077 RepID=A0ABP5AQJ8_9ACTN
MSGAGAVENPHAGTGSVLLDIGGDVGALVVHVPESMTGDEIEIHPAGTDLAALREPHDHGHGHGHGHDHGHAHHQPHVAVVQRPTASGPRPSLVYPEVTEGSWVLCPVGGTEAVLTAEVRGGAVTEVSWPA